MEGKGKESVREIEEKEVRAEEGRKRRLLV